jgi:cell division protein FtsZ
LKMLENELDPHSPAKIKVVGIGGGGCNAIDRMIEQNVMDVEYIALNTDAQVLTKCHAPIRLQIGANITAGKGTGGNPAIGLKAAEESAQDIKELLEGADMVFITAGMGGGTGTGGAPVVAKIARSLGALTVAAVTKPFSFEGGRRLKAAIEGIAQLQESVDTMIVIPNDRLLQIVDKKATLTQAFLAADEMLKQGILGITEIISVTALVNVDFQDVRTIMTNAGAALMAIGIGKGEHRAADAAAAAIKSNLLETTIDGAKGVLYMIKGSHSLGLLELNEAAEIIRQMVDPDANIKFGAAIDDNMGDEIQITIIATGFDGAAKAVPVRRDSIPVQRTGLQANTQQQQPAPVRSSSQPQSQVRATLQSPTQPLPQVRTTTQPQTPARTTTQTPVWKPSSSNIIDFTARTTPKPVVVDVIVDDDDVPDFLRRSQQSK